MLLGFAVRQGQAPSGSPLLLQCWKTEAPVSLLSRLDLQLVLQIEVIYIILRLYIVIPQCWNLEATQWRNSEETGNQSRREDLRFLTLQEDK